MSYFIEITCPYVEERAHTDISSEEYLDLYLEADCPATFIAGTDTCQCNPGRRRSLLDLYSLLKTKYPDYTFVRLARDLINVLKLPKIVYFSTIYKRQIFRCGDIRRVVVGKNTNSGYLVSRSSSNRDLDELIEFPELKKTDFLEAINILRNEGDF